MMNIKQLIKISIILVSLVIQTQADTKINIQPLPNGQVKVSIKSDKKWRIEWSLDLKTWYTVQVGQYDFQGTHGTTGQTFGYYRVVSQ